MVWPDKVSSAQCNPASRKEEFTVEGNHALILGIISNYTTRITDKMTLKVTTGTRAIEELYAVFACCSYQNRLFPTTGPNLYLKNLFFLIEPYHESTLKQLHIIQSLMGLHKDAYNCKC